MTLVTGEIVFMDEDASFSGATVHVRLEEVGRADAPATVVAQDVVENFSREPGDAGGLSFALTSQVSDERASYSVRAHVDVDGDGEVGTGDFISTESYPVLTWGHPDHVTVRVRRI